MKQVELGRDRLEIEHEGERYRLSGELGDGTNEMLDVFFAWRNWTKQLTMDGQAVPLSEEEKERVMNLVKECWPNEGLRICFLNDDLRIICETAPAIKKTRRVKRKEKSAWYRENWKQVLIMILFLIGLLVLPGLSVYVMGRVLAYMIPLMLAGMGTAIKTESAINILLDILSCALIIAEIMTGSFLIVAGQNKRKLWLQKHWKTMIIVSVIVFGLMFSLNAAKHLFPM